MWFKIYSDDRCPNCGRNECSERVKRSRLIRLFFPETKLMKCRLCQCRFLVRMATS